MNKSYLSITNPTHSYMLTLQHKSNHHCKLHQKTWPEKNNPPSVQNFNYLVFYQTSLFLPPRKFPFVASVEVCWHPFFMTRYNRDASFSWDEKHCEFHYFHSSAWSRKPCGSLSRWKLSINHPPTWYYRKYLQPIY